MMFDWLQNFIQKAVATHKCRHKTRWASRKEEFDPNETQHNTVFLYQNRNTLVDTQRIIVKLAFKSRSKYIRNHMQKFMHDMIALLSDRVQNAVFAAVNDILFYRIEMKIDEPHVEDSFRQNGQNFSSCGNNLQHDHVWCSYSASCHGYSSRVRWRFALAQKR